MGKPVDGVECPMRHPDAFSCWNMFSEYVQFKALGRMLFVCK